MTNGRTDRRTGKHGSFHNIDYYFEKSALQVWERVDSLYQYVDPNLTNATLKSEEPKEKTMEDESSSGRREQLMEERAAQGEREQLREGESSSGRERAAQANKESLTCY